MKLGELLIEQKDGRETLTIIRENNDVRDTSDLISKHTDEDYNIILVSSFLEEYVSKIEEVNSEITCSFKNICEEFKLLEERKMSKGKVPTIFGRMELDIIKENYEIIQEELQDLKLLKKYDKKELAQALAFVGMSIKMFAEESNNNSFFIEKFENSVLNEAVKKEEELLISVLNS